MPEGGRFAFAALEMRFLLFVTTIGAVAGTATDAVSCVTDGRTLVRWPRTAAGMAVVPDGIDNMAPGAFSGCSLLEGVRIPQGVTNIGREAFLACTRLELVDLPETLSSVGDRAFAGCRKLRELSFPKGLRRIGDGVFDGAFRLTCIRFSGDAPAVGMPAYVLADSAAKLVVAVRGDSFGWGNCETGWPVLVDPRFRRRVVFSGGEDMAGMEEVETPLDSRPSFCGNYAFRGMDPRLRGLAAEEFARLSAGRALRLALAPPDFHPILLMEFIKDCAAVSCMVASTGVHVVRSPIGGRPDGEFLRGNETLSASRPISPAHFKCAMDLAGGLKSYRYVSLCRADGEGAGLAYVSSLSDGEVACFRCFDMVEDVARCMAALEWKGVDWGESEHTRRMYRALVTLLDMSTKRML